jgi:spermidine/putrescine transport system substrate-binding protein
MLEGENSTELSNLIGSGNPNLAARPYIRAEVTSDPAIFPVSTEKLEMLHDLDRHQRRLLSRLWTEIKLR